MKVFHIIHFENWTKIERHLVSMYFCTRRQPNWSFTSLWKWHDFERLDLQPLSMYHWYHYFHHHDHYTHCHPPHHHQAPVSVQLAVSAIHNSVRGKNRLHPVMPPTDFVMIHINSAKNGLSFSIALWLFLICVPSGYLFMGDYFMTS